MPSNPPEQTDTIDAELVERVAAAMWAHRTRGMRSFGFDTLTEEEREPVRDEARAAILATRVGRAARRAAP